MIIDYVLFGAIAGDVCGSSYEAKFRKKLNCMKWFV